MNYYKVKGLVNSQEILSLKKIGSLILHTFAQLYYVIQIKKTPFYIYPFLDIAGIYTGSIGLVVYCP